MNFMKKKTFSIEDASKKEVLKSKTPSIFEQYQSSTNVELDILENHAAEALSKLRRISDFDIEHQDLPDDPDISDRPIKQHLESNTRRLSELSRLLSIVNEKLDEFIG